VCDLLLIIVTGRKIKNWLLHVIIPNSQRHNRETFPRCLISDCRLPRESPLTKIVDSHHEDLNNMKL
jgi:hypothetical protein